MDDMRNQFFDLLSDIGFVNKAKGIKVCLCMEFWSSVLALLFMKCLIHYFERTLLHWNLLFSLTCRVVDVLTLYPVYFKEILFVCIQSMKCIGTMRIAVGGEACVRIFFSCPLVQLWFSDDAYFVRYFYNYHIVFFSLLGFFHKEKLWKLLSSSLPAL